MATISRSRAGVEAAFSCLFTRSTRECFNAGGYAPSFLTATRTTPRHLHRRWQTTSASTTSTSTPPTASLSPRWLSDVKQRIGYCLMWGLLPEQTHEAGLMLKEITQDWRELLAGSEGYLTDATRRGLFRQEVVWGECDSMAHVNNVMINRYAESGRVKWFRNYGRFIDPAHKGAWEGLVTPKGDGLILKKITTEFKFPMTFPDHVTIYHRLATEPQAGDDTIYLHVLILSELHQRPAARCQEENVFYDYKVGKKIALRPFMLDALKETWKLQEANRNEFSTRVRSLLEKVEKLENESWNRPDAKEAFGTS